MNFTNSPYETMMKRPSHIQPPATPKAPKGSRCDGCPYWRGIACMSCYRDLLKTPDGGR
ncbi:hypothetical protein [Faecalibacterium sp.]|jgi:hypothetical protein|uniref:hypothetical protein n=1 Tax=Faecalibacterium sp. TaxID=1971605 RepID=UPI004025C0F7